MKTHRLFPLSVVIVSISVGCASSGAPRDTDRTVLTSEEIQRNENEPIEQMLQRKFPGVQVVRDSDGEITLQIRGAASPSGIPHEPLIVLNDMEMPLGGRGLLSIVNPHDIEAIRVLKGPEAAIYGLRGADGVIIIKTKDPRKK